MNKTNPIKVGNENFKTWLKKIDPVARVEMMSAIAQTQASAGLRGSLIKASLAQLSQRCQVMLIRLTEKEIRHYIRRKAVERLVTPDATAKKTKNENGSPKLVNVDLDQNTKSRELKNNNSFIERSEKHIYDKKKVATSKYNTKHQQNLTKEKFSPKTITLNPNSDHDNKLKKTFKELFGDDLDDESGFENGSNKINDIQGNNYDKNFNNYLSTTVNVNIYNSSSSSNDGTNSNLLKRRSHTENGVLSVSESSNKRLRVDVSFSDENSVIDKRNVPTLIESYQSQVGRDLSEIANGKKAKKLSSHNKPKRLGTSKNKSKSASAKISKSVPSSLNITKNVSEEDPSIKELWSILGMESPTDRSKSIKCFPPTSSAMEIVGDSRETESSLQNNISMQPNQTSSEITQNCRQQPTNHTHQEQSNKSSSAVTHITQDAALENNSVGESTPLCKITETFSLSEETRTEPNIFIVDSMCVSSDAVDIENEKCLDVVKKYSDTQSKFNGVTDSNTYETIWIPDDDDDDDNPGEAKTGNINGNTQKNESIAEKSIGSSFQIKSSEQSKIGTIRVKSLGLLMNPQQVTSAALTSDSVASTSSAISTPKNKESSTSNSQWAKEPVPVEIPNIGSQPIKERFYTVYKYYFNEVVESKIPKLGELLHLALSDSIRRSERIKRAEQLSSYDLITEEKQRADKDFNDMMKTRGCEFSPLCEDILNKFDMSSKITLFISLFCRILKHAEQIEPGNRNYTLEARSVVRIMLLKTLFKDNEVLECLRTDPEEFQGQVNLVNSLIEKAVVYDEQFKIQSKKASKVTKTKRMSSNTPNRTNIQLDAVQGTSNQPTQAMGNNSVPQKQNTKPIGVISSPSNATLNKSVTQSSAPSKSSPLPMSGTRPLSISVVNVPQTPFLKQPRVGSTTSMLQRPYNGSRSLPLLMQRLNHQILNLTHKTKTNPVNLTSQNSNFHPPPSVNTALSQRSLVCLPVSSQSNVSSPSCVQLNKPSPQAQTNGLGTGLANVNTPKNNFRPIIIRDIDAPSSPAIIGMDPSNLSIIDNDTDRLCKQPQNVNSLLSNTNHNSSPMVATVTQDMGPKPLVKKSNQTGAATVESAAPESASSAALESASLSLTNLLNSQSQVPASSHCHPFVMRMPISGKMRMLFGNKS